MDPARATSGRCCIAAVGITLVSLTDTIATSAAFAARRGDEVDPNQEMIGIGAANIAAGLLPGLRGVDERLAHRGRRAVRARRASSPASSARASSSSLLLLFLNSLLADLPQSALAAVVIAAALSLLNLGALRRYCAVRRSRAAALARRDASA